MGLGNRTSLRESRTSAGELRLVCFPHAGAGASAYRGWADLLAPHVRVITVQLPGREDRIREPAHRRLDQLLDEVVPELADMPDGPFALFGHSMGAVVAYEVARRLREESLPQPTHLFVSGRAAPHTPDRDAHIARLPDAQFHEALRRLNGFPTEVLADPVLMRLIEPTLRADFQLCESYHYQPGVLLDYPISVLGGTRDTVVREYLHEWRAHTLARCAVRMVPGDHAFVMTHRDLVTTVVCAELDLPVTAGDQVVG